MVSSGPSCALALVLVSACRFTTADTEAIDAPAGDARTRDAPGVDAPGTMFCDADGRLRGCYTFDDTMLDGSGNANDAIAAGIIMYTAGRTGQAVVTTSSAIRIAASPSLSFSALTLQMSIKPAWVPTMRAGLIDSTGYRMFLEPGGRIRCAINDGATSGTEVISTITVPVGTWSRVACTYDLVKMRVWLGGAEIASESFDDPIAPVTGNLTIGQNEPSGDNFAGAIDELRIWSAALDAP